MNLKEKKCLFCGEMFQPKNSNQKYCKKDHVRICPVCRSEYVETHVENLSRPPVACSYACRKQMSKNTNLSKYSSEEYFSSDKFKSSTCTRSFRSIFKGHLESSRHDIQKILYEDEKYIVFQSQDDTILSNRLISNYIQSTNKTPVVVYLDENPDRVLGQLELKDNIQIDSSDLTVYKLNTETTKEFIAENDYNKNIEGIVFSLGLVKHNTIYQVMIFGQNKHNKDYKLQLLRTCNKYKHTITGGLDKLSSVASHQFEICRCIAYQDQSKSFMNERLESIGMRKIRSNHGKKIERSGQVVYGFDTNVYTFE